MCRSSMKITSQHSGCHIKIKGFCNAQNQKFKFIIVHRKYYQTYSGILSLHPSGYSREFSIYNEKLMSFFLDYHTWTGSYSYLILSAIRNYHFDALRTHCRCYVKLSLIPVIIIIIMDNFLK